GLGLGELVARAVVRRVHLVARRATHVAVGMGTGRQGEALASLVAREANSVFRVGRHGFRAESEHAAHALAAAILGVLERARSVTSETAAPVCRRARIRLGTVPGGCVAVEVWLVAGLADVLGSGFLGGYRLSCG